MKFFFKTASFLRRISWLLYHKRNIDDNLLKNTTQQHIYSSKTPECSIFEKASCFFKEKSFFFSFFSLFMPKRTVLGGPNNGGDLGFRLQKPEILVSQFTRCFLYGNSIFDVLFTDPLQRLFYLPRGKFNYFFSCGSVWAVPLSPLLSSSWCVSTSRTFVRARAVCSSKRLK